MMGHVPSWLQWQGSKCHCSPQKASPTCAPDAEQRVLHQWNPTGAISCSLVDGSARREHTQNLAYLLLCSRFDWLYAP